MFGQVIRALLYLCFVVLAYYLILWVLAALGIQLPLMVERILGVILILVAILVLYQLFRPYLRGIDWWGRGPPACFVIFVAGILAGCGGVQMQPADPAVTARIVTACTADGVFKAVGGRLVLSMVPVPGGATAAQIVAAGVDRVCADPAAFSADLSTAEWVVKNLAAGARRGALE